MKFWQGGWCGGGVIFKMCIEMGCYSVWLVDWQHNSIVIKKNGDLEQIVYELVTLGA